MHYNSVPSAYSPRPHLCGEHRDLELASGLEGLHVLVSHSLEAGQRHGLAEGPGGDWDLG